MNLNLSVFIHFIFRKKNLLAYAPTIIVGARVTFDFIELEIKQAASDFCKIRKALSLSTSFFNTSLGNQCTSVIKNLPSICSHLPLASQAKSVNSNLEFSAMAKNVVIKLQ